MPLGSSLAAQSRGFTLVSLLAMLAMASLALAAAGPLWSQQRQRQQDRELVRIGAVYVQALQSYRSASPGAVPQYPTELSALLLDPRQLGVVRHLRRLYPDPINPNAPWGLLRNADGGIVGIYSQSDRAPLAQRPAGVYVQPSSLPVRYVDWKFLAETKP